MSNVLKMFAVEFDGGSARGFNLADQPLGDQHLYQGIQLFQTVEMARAEADSENSVNADDEADDEFSVTPVMLYASGEIKDEFGSLLNADIARMAGHSAQKVASDVRAMHAYQGAALRKQLAAGLAQPGL